MTKRSTVSTLDLLFRAYEHPEKEDLEFHADIVDFDLDFRRKISLRVFANNVEEHLQKTEKSSETVFVSTSPMLQWTIHKTGQKYRYKKAERKVELAIFDVRR